MITLDNEILPIPGLDVVGRGIYLRPHHPYELKDILFKRENNRICHSRETGENYSVPEGYEINDSPPMPARQALNQVVIEESYERFDKQMGLDTNLALSNYLFSIDVNAGQTKQLRSEEEAYYALRSSFIPLWTIYIPDVTRFSDITDEIDIPVPFDPGKRRVYEKIFERYGTHYVKRVWVGGKAMLVFTISKASQMTKEEIYAGIKASYGGIGSGGISGNLKHSKEKLQNHSECTVFGKGGDELKLASLSTLDESLYNEWLTTIKANPQVVELEVAGIWTLIRDAKKAKVLLDAYKAATAFIPISAVFNIDKEIYFIRGDKYVCYNVTKQESKSPQLVSDLWPVLHECGFERIDSAFRGDFLIAPDGEEDLSGKLFFFRRNRYICLDISTGTIDKGYPKRISEGWPGVVFDKINAVTADGADSIYFFSGNQYIRYNISENRADEGYPETISKRWVGLTFDRIDAAIYWGNAKVYFFREDQHIRYDMVTFRADPGYPKFIIGTYAEDWKFFD